MNKLRENRRYAAELQDRMTMQMQQACRTKETSSGASCGCIGGLIADQKA